MRLSRIFVEQSLAINATVQLDVPASHYIRHVLRLKSESAIVLFNGADAYNYHATLSFDGKRSFASVVSKSADNTESTLDSEIIQGLSRNDHLDWMIQKATELGVRHISIFNANHSQILVKPSQLEKKRIHWRAIAIKACEQSGRFFPPQIHFFNDMPSMLDARCQARSLFLLDFEGPRLMTSLATLSASESANRPVSILLGPEGGLSDTEKSLAKRAGFQPSQLGSRVLRTETAAITALCIIQSALGDI